LTIKSNLYLPPKGAWERKDAASLGIDQSILDKAVQFAKDNEIKWPIDIERGRVGNDAPEWDAKLGPFKDRGGPAGLVIKDGYIVAEWGDIERVDLTYSATKSYVATMAGLAFDKGMIKSTQDPVIDYEAGKSITMAATGEPVDGFDTDQNRGITWEHLLQQSSEWEGTLYSKPDVVDWNRSTSGTGTDDAGETGRQERKAPGEHYEYNDVRVNRTALALLAVWGEPLPGVLKREVMDHIGASNSWIWHGYGENSTVNLDGLVTESVSGGAHWGGGLWVNTLDHARFGMLYLNRGRWGDRQIISEKWIDMMTVPSANNPLYGYMWWLNTGHGLNRASESTFAASGAGGNVVEIDPEKNLVVVTRWCEPDQVAGVVNLVVEAVTGR
jgi:CubicO group peptidase (beta-lactamase class C family)